VSILNQEEHLRYSRHLVLKDFGIESQQLLKDAKVLVIGAGGLGSPALLYLAAAGVGTIGIVDYDTIQLSNLQRQILFKTEDVNKNKAEAGRTRLAELNPLLQINSIPYRISAANALDIIRPYSVVIDGSDNYETRYLLNDACIIEDKPLIYGSVLQFEGQVSVFNVKSRDGYSCNYRDLFPQPPSPEQTPNCEQAGVLGVLPGIIGTLQATEAIKLITGKGDLLINRLLLFDGLSMEFNVIQIKNKNTRQTVTKLIDYDEFCARKEIANASAMKEITVQEFKELISSGNDFQLIDVREAYEFELCNINGENIPLSQIPHHIERIDRIKKVIIHCKSGSRGNQAVLWLERNHQFTNLYNLKGGISEWAVQYDRDMIDFL
jgi:molybdopterin/thiamine biosynthesis adenylyltransferase/rhodanese-related sulfurtransferase